MTDVEAGSWPQHGVVRVHRDPTALPVLGDEPGPYRFDDPRPRTQSRFLVRYAARNLRGCLLEILDWLRDNDEAERRIAEVEIEDGETEPDTGRAGAALEDYLAERQVGALQCDSPSVVSINGGAVQAQLDREPAVRAVLDSDEARSALLETGGDVVHLDGAAVRLSGETGRTITQACALALHDRTDRPDAIEYSSRHADEETCWAIFGDVNVDFVSVRPLDPAIDGEIVRDVAAMWGLHLPESWKAPS